MFQQETIRMAQLVTLAVWFPKPPAKMEIVCWIAVLSYLLMEEKISHILKRWWKNYVNWKHNTLFFIIFPSEYILGRCEIFCLDSRFDCRWVFARKCAKIGGR